MPAELQRLEGSPGASTSAEAAPAATEPDWLVALRLGELPAQPLDLRGQRLIGLDLSGLALIGADLSGANLSRANLSDTVLMGARLVGTILFEAVLDGAELTAADLTRANLEHARGERVGLGGAILRDAKMMQVSLPGATLTRADLSRADLRSASLPGARLHEATLADADLTGANLTGVDLAHASVSGARLDEADLRDTTLTGLRCFDEASWIGADMRDINFAGAYLVRRFVMDQNYLDEFRSRSRWNHVVYRMWWATSDCGRSLTRWALWVAALVALFAWLYTLVEVDYGDYQTPLSALYYSVVTMTTLGYGDVLPASAWAQAVAMCEVVVGYMMLGGLLSIFSNKMARRAE